MNGVQTFQNLLFKAYTDNAAKVAAEEAREIYRLFDEFIGTLPPV